MNNYFKRCRYVCCAQDDELSNFIRPGFVYEYRDMITQNKTLYKIIDIKTLESQTISEEQFKKYFKPLEI